MEYSSYSPHDWYWAVATPAGSIPARVWSSREGAWVESWDDTKLTRIASEAELTAVLEAYGLAGPYVSADHVRKEASRRMQMLVAARDEEHLMIIQLKAHEEAVALLDALVGGAKWTSAQASRATELREIRRVFQEIRDASNVLEDNPPLDYRDDKHWPNFGATQPDGWIAAAWARITSALGL